MDKRIFTIKQLVERHPFLTENTIRWILYKNEAGLQECLIRNSRRIYIIEDAFFDFLLQKSQKYKEKKGLTRTPESLKVEQKIDETA